MPREAVNARARARPGAAMVSQKSTMKMPLNDDRQEKAARFQSRQALHEIQMNQIKAAAVSPMKKRKSLNASDMGSPRTPSSSQDKENFDSPGIAVVAPGTPMKRVPILANFEEWMKMATDNKINAANSWNFALIDYFHDMSLLREGDSVNFQKASCTLDGCVKIYTSRVDSVATETGKLLSGLADSRSKKKGNSSEEGGEGDGEEDEDEEGEEGVKKRTKKKAQRSSEATLASSFAQLQLKKMELEFSVDPLFKKASADFDEGGAKGLLLNHLTIDAHGRIVFDSSDDVEEPTESTDEENAEDEDNTANTVLSSSGEAETKQAEVENSDINLDDLRQRFFPDLAVIDEQEVCAPMKTFELEGASDAMDIPFLKASDDWKNAESSTDSNDLSQDNESGGMGLGDDDDDEGMMAGFDVGADVGFGEGGEAWAKEAALNTQPTPWVGMSEEGDGDEGIELGGDQDNGQSQYSIKLTQGQEIDRENILKYFDQALSKNWAGPEHWRIRKIKDSTKPQQPGTKKKEKEPFEVDFSGPMTRALSDTIYTPAATNSAISLPKSQWKSKTRNLLPDDKHFNSRQLLSLFLKPRARIGYRRLPNGRGRHGSHEVQGEMNEAFWAREQLSHNNVSDDAGMYATGDYDANFFQDDGLGMLAGLQDDDDDDFADARESFSPGVDGVEQITPGSLDDINANSEQGFGSQLVTQSRRLRPEYVQYARVAKKVDVRRLKEEMWRGMGLENATKIEQTPQPEDRAIEPEEATLKFTNIMNSLQTVYPAQAMADISTSYCFISLLHLANEKGLILQHDESFQEISVQRDFKAEITGEA